VVCLSDVAELAENGDDALVVCVLLRDEREQEAGIKEDHVFGWPYK